MEFVLNQRLHREQHIAVDIVQQIERGQYEQRGAGMELLRGHGLREYSIAKRKSLFCHATLIQFWWRDLVRHLAVRIQEREGRRAIGRNFHDDAFFTVSVH